MYRLEGKTILSLIVYSIALQTFVVANQRQSQNEYLGAMKIQSTSIGKDQFRFVANPAAGKTKPDSCKICVIKPPNDTKLCCEEGDASSTGAEECDTHTFEGLDSAAEYQLNMCHGTNNILTQKFKTGNLPITKKVTYDENAKIMTYNVKYRKQDEIPTNCKLIDPDGKPFSCTDNNGCGCESGSLKVEPTDMSKEFHLVDMFGGWLYLFTPTGALDNDPIMYNFTIDSVGINSLSYKISSIFFDIKDSDICSIINTEDDSKLKCKVDEKITENCICKSGTIVELNPSTEYIVDIKLGEDLINKGAIFKTDPNKYLEVMQVQSTSIGKDQFKFVANPTEGKEKPDSCKICVIKPPNDNKLCCEEGDTSVIGPDKCDTHTFGGLELATEYQLNMCYGTTTNNILTHKFKTRNLPISKKVTYDESTKIMTYNVKYRKEDETPTNCKLTDPDGNSFTCIDNNECGCESGSIQVEPTDISKVFHLVDIFGGWLYLFTPTGALDSDPKIYTYTVHDVRMTSLTYRVHSEIVNFQDGDTCSIINTEDNSKLKCKVGELITENCICNTGIIVELKPTTKYIVDIKMGEDLIYEGAILKTGRVGERINHVIGMDSYKYTIDYESDFPRIDRCRACVIKKSVPKECCKDEHFYTHSNHCASKIFTKVEMDRVGGTEFKINICDIHENHIISDSFSMPKPLETTEFTVTTGCILYRLDFENDQGPTYCKFKIQAASEDQIVNTNCLNAEECLCSYGSISYPSEINSTATLIIYDYFDVEIKREPIDLSKKDTTIKDSEICTEAMAPESSNQGLSGGATAGIVVFVLILIGSAGGVAYYMIQVRGKNSDS